MPLCHLLATRFSSGSCSEQRDFQRLPWNFQSPSPLPKKLLAWIQAVTIISLYQSCLLPKQEVFRLPEECNGFVLSDGAWEVCVRVCVRACVCLFGCMFETKVWNGGKGKKRRYPAFEWEVVFAERCQK